MLFRSRAGIAASASRPATTEIYTLSLHDALPTSVWAAFVATAEEVGGRYCEDCQVSQVTDGLISPVSPGVRPYALDPERAKALWARSEDLVGEHF